ncbi:hypothetical protein Tco_0624254 [Tanacetum coccineum]|uniref:Uncharacterized protein n=1 Tax=Tanacetum coccineum TaxID=301880 RepID=A0ABQ4WDI3_9ASTR
MIKWGSNTGKQQTVFVPIARGRQEDCSHGDLSRQMGSDALMSQTETEITSDSNIIPYSQYLSETQQETVQNSNSSTQQDVLILSMFEQLNTQVMHCTNVNLEYKSANKALDYRA